MKPIIFSGEMVRAILAGRKTQTRRVIKSAVGSERCLYDPAIGWRFAGGPNIRECSYGQPGDLLWVRETWRAEELDDRYPQGGCDEGLVAGMDGIRFAADNAFVPIENTPEASARWAKARKPLVNGKWRPSIHMPTWASRITLRITCVRVERLQDISEEDAQAEGVRGSAGGAWGREGLIEDFAALWDSINAKRGHGWDTSPWVWVISFERIMP